MPIRHAYFKHPFNEEIAITWREEQPSEDWYSWVAESDALLRSRVPESVLCHLLSISSGEHGLTVTYKNGHKILIPLADWLSDEYVAYICLESP